MINSAVSQYQTDLTNLAWVENYGGITRLVKHPQKSEELVQYPVSPFVSFSECWNEGIYKALVPSDNIASVVYYEEDSNTIHNKTSIISGSSNNIELYETPVRLICWINLNKLGLDHTTDKSGFVNDLLNIFSTTKTSNGARIEVNFREVDSEDETKTVFEKYNYKDFEKLLYYPYMAISIRLTFRQIGKQSCFASQAVNAEITCKNYAYTS